MREIGEALGEESLQEHVDVLLGPGVNTKRSPSAGAISNTSPRTPVSPGRWPQPS